MAWHWKQSGVFRTLCWLLMQEFIPDNDGHAFKRKMPKIKVHEREEVPVSIGHDDQHLPYPHLSCQPLEQFIQTSTAGTIISTPHQTESWRIHLKLWLLLCHIWWNPSTKCNSTLTSPDVYKFMLKCKLKPYEKCTFDKHPLFLLPSPFDVIWGGVSDINNGLKQMHPKIGTICKLKRNDQ